MGSLSFGNRKHLFGVLNILNPGWYQPGLCVVLARNARELVRLVSPHQGREVSVPRRIDHLGT